MNIKLFDQKIIRYACIGGSSTAIHIFVAFLYLKFIADSIFFSNIVGFLGAFLFSYALQSRYVFKHRLSFSKATRYFTVQVAALMVAIILTKLIPFDNYIKVVIIAFILPLITFFIHSLWTFSISKENQHVYK